MFTYSLEFILKFYWKILIWVTFKKSSGNFVKIKNTFIKKYVYVFLIVTIQSFINRQLWGFLKFISLEKTINIKINIKLINKYKINK